MSLVKPSVLIATLDWHYSTEDDRLTLGWDLFDVNQEERLCIGAAPGRHLYELEAEGRAALARLCSATRTAVGSPRNDPLLEL